jgi:hypothetical protein
MVALTLSARLLRLRTAADSAAVELLANPPDDPGEYIALISLADEIAESARLLRSTARLELIKRTARGKHAFGNHLVRRTRTLKRSDWRSVEIASRLASQGVGLVEAIPAMSVSYWKAGNRNDDQKPGLAWWGIDRDDYCTVTSVDEVTVEEVSL